MHVWVGDDERPEFVRQATLLANVWTGLGADMALTIEPGRHHFDVIDGLTDPGSALVEALVGDGGVKPQARVVVIGGGVVGCSVLYHLAKAGWTDAMLIERSELTSGSSWHAAGGFHTLNGDPNVAKLQAYTVALYRELEEISGQSCGLHLTGGVMLAGDPERMDFLRLAHAKGRCLGMDTEIITPSEAAAMFPLMDPSHFVGALWDPVEGHLDPAGTTHAYAKAAQKLGRDDRAAQPGGGADPGAGRARGTSSPSTARSRPSMWSTPAGSGRARSGGWSGSSCRCWRWSTCTC